MYTLVISSYWYIIHIVLYLLLGVKPSIYWRDWHWGLEKFHSLSSSEPLRRTLQSVTKMLGNIWQSWLAILFPRTSDFHPQATGFQRSAFAVNLAVDDPFWLFWPPPGSSLGFSKRLHQKIVLVKCVFFPASLCFQVGFDHTQCVVTPWSKTQHFLAGLTLGVRKISFPFIFGASDCFDHLRGLV